MIYPREHGVPHFHVEFLDGDRCGVAIETLDILSGTVRPMSKLDEPLDWAAENRALLMKKWKEITR